MHNEHDLRCELFHTITLDMFVIVQAELVYSGHDLSVYCYIPTFSLDMFVIVQAELVYSEHDLSVYYYIFSHLICLLLFRLSWCTVSMI